MWRNKTLRSKVPLVIKQAQAKPKRILTGKQKKFFKGKQK